MNRQHEIQVAQLRSDAASGALARLQLLRQYEASRRRRIDLEVLLTAVVAAENEAQIALAAFESTVTDDIVL